MKPKKLASFSSCSDARALGEFAPQRVRGRRGIVAGAATGHREGSAGPGCAGTVVRGRAIVWRHAGHALAWVSERRRGGNVEHDRAARRKGARWPAQLGEEEEEGAPTETSRAAAHFLPAAIEIGKESAAA